MLYLWNKFKVLSTSYPQFRNACVDKKSVLPVWKNAWNNHFYQLAECNFAAFVDCKNRTAAWTSESTCFCCSKLFVANRAGNNQREWRNVSWTVSCVEVTDSFFSCIFNIKELWESQKLEYLIYLWLNFQKNNISVLWFYNFKENSKRANTCWWYIVQCRAVENKIDISCFNYLCNLLLEKAWIIGIYVSIQINKNSAVNAIGLFKCNWKTVVFFVVKTWNNWIIAVNLKPYLLQYSNINYI